MRSRLRWILRGSAGAAQADVAVCNNFGWRRGAHTTCVTRPTQSSSGYIVRAGKLYHWSPQERTYYFENEYGNERCMDRVDLPCLPCVTQEEVTYCD